MFKCISYNVLIASPSDLAEERQAVSEAINDWNGQYARTELLVFLPVRWETHIAPETGVRPQEAVNRQIVRQTDILIGMFWTRLGAKTGVAESGTVEEIDQFVTTGRPAMLYFSERPIAPSKINLSQQRKLRRFKKTTCESALTATFASIDELQQIVTRHLTSLVHSSKLRRIPIDRKRLDAFDITELMRAHKEYGIAFENLQSMKRA